MEPWEYDFSPNPDTSVCPHCTQMYITDAGVTKEVFNGRETVTLHYCSTQCSHEAYLDRLRRDL